MYAIEASTRIKMRYRIEQKFTAESLRRRGVFNRIDRICRIGKPVRTSLGILNILLILPGCFLSVSAVKSLSKIT